MSVLLVIGGLAALLAGGELFVRSSAALALRLGLSPLVVGMTVVGFGTSLPELVTSVEASLSGAPGIALGNVLGSNIANILLILGLASLLAPIAVPPGTLRTDGLALAAATGLAVVVVANDMLTRPAGAALIGALLAYTIVSLRGGARRAATVPAGTAVETGPRAGRAADVRLALGLAAGLLLVLVGAQALVSGALEIAVAAGLPEAFLGVTLVAVGTSLPELVTSVLAARNRQSELALGNILGSNIFNLMGILGAAAVIAPFTVPAELAGRDLWIMCAATAALLGVMATGRLSRLAGLVFLAAYGGFLALAVSALT